MPSKRSRARMRFSGKWRRYKLTYLDGGFYPWGRRRKTKNKGGFLVSLGMTRRFGPLQDFFELAEAWVIANGIPHGIHLEENHPVGTFLQTLTQPFDGLIRFAEAEINAGDHRRGKISSGVIVY